MPNASGKSLYQNDTLDIGQGTLGAVPNIRGSVEINTGTHTFNGAFYSTNVSYSRSVSSSTHTTDVALGFDASKSSSVYTDDITRVIPAAIHIVFAIKY